LRDIPLKQVVKAPTRKQAVLDKIFTNISHWYQEPMILPEIGQSDHQAIVMFPTASEAIKKCRRTAVVVRSDDTNSKSLLARSLAAFNWLPLYQMSSTESMVSFFYDAMTSLLDEHLPTHTVYRHSSDKPWVTDEFRRLIRQRQYAFTNNNKPLFNQLRNKVNRLSKRLRKQFYEKKVKGLRNCNPANWWRDTKRLTGQSSKPDLVGLANEHADGDMPTLANLINQSLIRVSNDLVRLDEFCEDHSDSLMAPPGELDYTISPEDVFRKLERINIRKAPGPDCLPNWFLRDFAFALCDPLCAIFNSSIAEGVVPAIWKQANITAVPKTRPPRLIESDLRPISLTPTLSKVFESLVGKWILEVLNEKFDKKQYGALKGRSTTHALTDMLHTWHKALDEEQSVKIVFVDYAKAFDHVDHETIMSKLVDLGVPQVLIRWLHSFMSNRQQRVKIGEIVSEWASPNGGMPQGTWFGVYIFLTLINDLKSEINLHKFVDDCTLSETLSRFGSSMMQHEVDKLNDWSKANHMNINTKKTKEMIIGNIKKEFPPSLRLNDNEIERVSVYKLLGLYVNDNLTWNDHVSSICTKSAQRLHFLKLLKRAGISSDDLLYYYKSVIRPVTEYACFVWHSSLTKDQSAQLETMQRRAVRLIFDNDNQEIYNAMRSLTSLADRREQLANQFFKSLLVPTNCLHHLLPAKRDSTVIAKLRHASQYSGFTARTERFKNSAISYALNNFQ